MNDETVPTATYLKGHMNTAILTLSNGVRAFLDRDGAVLLNVRTGKYYSVNSVGGRICSLLLEGASESHIAGTVAGEYGIDQSLATRDTLEFLNSLRRNRLVESRAADGQAGS